ncbi:MAG: hypothetical protein RL095_3113 [Verrucomicrobiota bacterium]|jgi:acetoin utilization protein AcuB
MSTTVAQIMSTALITVEMDFTLEVIEQIMIKRKIGHVLVVDQGRLVGIIADSDVKRQISPRSHSDLATTAEQRLLFTKAHQFMSRQPITVSPEASILEALNLLLNHHIHALPVLDQGRLVGIITDGDLLRAFRNQLERETKG